VRYVTLNREIIEMPQIKSIIIMRGFGFLGVTFDTYITIMTNPHTGN
jgi:hypothetical protein